MNAKECLEKYKDLKVAEVVVYDPTVYCNVAAMPKWDIPEKVVIGVAFTGSFLDKRQNPNQPMKTDEIIEDAKACVEAGASYLHFHVRDENGMNCGDPEGYHEIVDPLRKMYGDKIVIDGCPLFGADFVEANAPVTDGLFEVGIVNPVCTFVGDNVRWLPPAAIKAQAEYFRALGKRVMVSIHDTASIDNVKRWLIDTDILEKPYFFGLLGDMPGMCYMPNPKAIFETLTLMINRLKELDPDCTFAVAGSGRASSYLTTAGALLGLHIRVGTEDTVWRFPHRDEKVTSNLQAFLDAKQICESLGREVATAEETRKILGISPFA